MATTAQPRYSIGPSRGWFDINFAEIWEYRELMFFFVWRDIKVRYKQTAIGAAWAVLQPLATMAVFTLFFGRLAKIPSDGLPYPVFYFSALLPWMYFSHSLSSATNVVVENQRVITKVYFPRVILPISGVLGGLVDLAISFVVLMGMVIYYGLPIGLNLLFLPLFILLAMLTALGAGFWLSALNAVYRDVRYVLPFLVQFWMFASPVAYPSSLVPERWRWVYGLNPLAGVIEGFRWAVTGKGAPPDGLLLVASVAAVGLIFVGGLIYFRHMEDTVADVV
jgi:lipopolysaccharide transport system permease protein